MCWQHCSSRQGGHIVTGDAINSRAKTAQHLLHHMKKIRRDFGGLQYCLVVIKCAAHHSNLIGMAVIRGGTAKDPTENCPVAAACSRLFKHLTPWYTDELVWALRASVDRKPLVCSMDVVVSAAVEAPSKRIHGCEGLSIDPTAVFDCGTQNFQHASACPDRRHACCVFFSVTGKRMLFLEERPVVGLFWLFSRCVWTLLHEILCHEVFKTTRVTPQMEMSQRLIRVLSFCGRCTNG